MQLFLFYIIYSILGFYASNNKSKAEESVCGDWKSFNNKCFKVLNSFGTEQEAINACTIEDSSSSLLSISSKDEQDFLTNVFLKTSNIEKGVWIGAKLTNTEFKRSDGSLLYFSNWINDKASKKYIDKCVKMITTGVSTGKWENVPCNTNLAIVCQKELRTAISFKNVREIEKELPILQFERDSIKSESKSIKPNEVPLGFVYVQLPNQPEPKNLWPSVKWRDGSSEYESSFFIEIDENSAAFRPEEEKVPQFTTFNDKRDKPLYQLTQSFPINDLSKLVESGDTNKKAFRLMSFQANEDHVKPRNQEVKIWIRSE